MDHEYFFAIKLLHLKKNIITNEYLGMGGLEKRKSDYIILKEANIQK